jgi:rhamnosyltransferase subunit B
VVLAPSVAFGARLAQERLGVPLATVHIYPFYLRSVHDNPLFPPWVPRAGRALAYRLLDTLVDARLARPLNAFRAELGLPAVHGIARGWWNSPERVIGLFPDWFGPPQPDWPRQTVLTGFPVYDERRTLATPAEVERFLDAGNPPVVFTTASWMRYARPFFEQSAEACGLLARRGLLVTPFPEQVPSRLPPGVRHFASVPYGWLLPRAAALVHHGGIGSTASALAAGIPHLVAPMVNDQPDNAARLARLGVARVLPSRRYRARRVAGALAELLGSREVAARCAGLAKEVRESRALEASCRLVETLVEE